MSRSLPTGRMLVGTALVLLGVGWLLGVLGYPLRWQVVLAGTLMAVGVALLAGARRPPQGGLVALGIILTILLALGVTFRPVVAVTAVGGSFGERTERPTQIGDLASDYRQGVGTLTLDLRNVDPSTGTTEVGASVGVGDLVVRAPEGPTVLVEARTGIGEVQVGEQRRDGVGVALREELPGDERVLSLRLEVGIGSLDVRR